MKKKYLIVITALIVVVLAATLLARRAPSTAVPTSQARHSYVAMGDSVAAGVGLSGDSDSSACDRTNQSYPQQVASALTYKLTNLACSGATLPEGILGSQDVNQLAVAPQITRLLALPKPDVVTLTVGANDTHWTTIIASCYSSVCGGDAQTATVNADLTTVSTNLSSTLGQIQTSYGAGVPKVLVTGYHQVFPGVGVATCSDLTGIDASELAWGRQLQTRLNDTIIQAVKKYSIARYVAVDFSGHELCTANPWVQGLSDQQPYHPTQAGQAEFARKILTAIKAY